ncbi:MAG: hypothetical protein ACE5IC_07115 [Candidatus Brocadiales bacterium]
MKEFSGESLRALYEYIHKKVPQENYREVDSDDEFRKLYGNQGIYALFTSGLPCLYDANRRVIFIPSRGYLSKSGKLDYSKALVAIAHEVGHFLSHNNSRKAQELINNAARTPAERKEIEALADEEAGKLLKKLGLTDRYYEIRERLRKQ